MVAPSLIRRPQSHRVHLPTILTHFGLKYSYLKVVSCLQPDIRWNKLTSLFKYNKFSSLLHLISGWNKESYTHHICAKDFRSFKELNQISMSSFLALDESDSTLSHDLPLQWPPVPQPTGDGPEPMRWIVNPPSPAFCDLPPSPPGQTKTSQGVEKTALIVKRSIVVSTDDAALLCVCVALAKTMIAQQQLKQNHNRTPHRHLLTLSHCKIIKKCQFAFFCFIPTCGHVQTCNK